MRLLVSVILSLRLQTFSIDFLKFLLKFAGFQEISVQIHKFIKNKKFNLMMKKK